jgi:hypothetical protein
MDAMDQRYSTAILAKRAYMDLLDQLNGESTPRAQSMLAERATWLHMALQKMEVDFARSGALDWRAYSQLTFTLTTVLKSLGIFETATAEEPLIQSFREALSRLPESGKYIAQRDHLRRLDHAAEEGPRGNS